MRELENHLKEGSVLVMVMVVMLVVTILGLTKLTVARHNAEEVIRMCSTTDGFGLAEMGLAKLVAITSVEENYISFADLGIVDEDTAVFSEEITDDNNRSIGSYQVYVQDADNVNGSPDWADYVVRSIGVPAMSGARSTEITTYARTGMVSDTVYGSEYEGNVRFATGDILQDDIRSNGRFIISGSPEFYGKVITSASYYKNENLSGNQETSVYSTDVFTEGILFNQPELPFSSETIATMSAVSAKTFNSDTTLQFVDNGRDRGVYMTRSGTSQKSSKEIVSYTVSWTTAAGVDKTKTISNFKKLGNAPANREGEVVENFSDGTQGYTWKLSTIAKIASGGDDADNIIYVDGVAQVYGEVDGTVSIISSDTIEVAGDLVYASKADDPVASDWDRSDPNDLPDSDELLGLFAKKKVMLTDHENNTDRNIHATIYVTDGNSRSYLKGFCVDGYNTARIGRPYINLYGCIIQKERGAVASGSSGYNKNYNQDYRLRDTPAPGTPLANPGYYNWSVATL